MELKQYLTLARKWLWLIGLSSLLTAICALLVCLVVAPVYEASTTMLISQAPSTRLSGSDYNAVLTSERLARTYSELLRKRPVLDQVIADLKLPLSAEDLKEVIKVSALRDTQLIVLSVEDTDPQRAAVIANMIVEEFGEQNRALQTSRYADSRKGLQQALLKLQDNIDANQKQLDEMQALSQPSSQQLGEIRQRQLLLAQYRDSFATLLKSYEDVRLAEVQATDTISVVEPATAPLEPVRPRTLLNTLLAALVGAMLAIGFVLLHEYLDDTVKTGDQVQVLAGAQPLAVISRMRTTRPQDLLVTAMSRGFPVAEAYRMLQVNIAFAALDKPARTLMITSSGPSEGKSTTAANLAIVMAQSGRSVILVDTDLRRPTLHQIFRLSAKQGFTTALLRPDTPLDEHLVASGVANLKLLCSGPLPPNPTELLDSRRLLELVERLKASAEIVIFDTPPVLAVADAPLLARVCDATLLVVLAGGTRFHALKRARAQLAQTGTRVLGVVLNRVPKAVGEDYGYYRYYRTSQDNGSTGKAAVPNGVLQSKNGHSKNGALTVISTSVDPD